MDDLTMTIISVIGYNALLYGVYLYGKRKGLAETTEILKEREGLFMEIRELKGNNVNGRIRELTGKNKYLQDLLIQIESDPTSGLQFVGIPKDSKTNKVERISSEQFFENWKVMKMEDIIPTEVDKGSVRPKFMSKEEFIELYTNRNKNAPEWGEHKLAEYPLTPDECFKKPDLIKKKPPMTKEEYLKGEDDYHKPTSERTMIINALRQSNAKETTPFEKYSLKDLKTLFDTLDLDNERF
jgi:hypothetical protein